MCGLVDEKEPMGGGGSFTTALFIQSSLRLRPRDVIESTGAFTVYALKGRRET